MLIERRVLRRQYGFDHPGGDFFEGYPDTILLKESRQKLAVAIKDVGGEVGLSLDDLVGGRQGGAELLDIESPPNRGPRKGHGSHEEHARRLRDDYAAELLLDADPDDKALFLASPAMLEEARVTVIRALILAQTVPNLPTRTT